MKRRLSKREVVDNSGSAYPVYDSLNCAKNSSMSLRDYFAGQALRLNMTGDAESMARQAYLIANCMIAERDKEILATIGEKPEKHHAQIINNSAIVDTCEEKFPHLWKEVTERDQYSHSSWYELSDEAYEEWERWQKA
jgi:hypothetical protein